MLIKKATEKDPSDWSALDFQLRAWLHLEGGDVQDNGKSWDTTKGEFFRLGPAVQLSAQRAPHYMGRVLLSSAVPGLYQPLSDHQHQSYLKLSSNYNFLEDDVADYKVSLAAQYQKGGLNFTKEDVDTFTLGLGILY